jgi:hypothetical protein
VERLLGEHPVPPRPRAAPLPRMRRIEAEEKLDEDE